MYGEIVCQTCLSSERLLHSVDNLECLLRDVNIHINNHGGVCWECKAIMDKFYRFKKQVIKAQDILISTVKVTSLSSLKECKTDINFHINFDESPPIAEVKIEENFTIHDVLDIIDEKPNFDDDMINHLSCDENEEISISLEPSSKSCYEIEKNLSPLEPRSKLCDEIEENPKLLKPRAKKKSSKFKIDIRKEGEEKKNDYKDKFTTIVFTEEEVNRHREEKRNHPNFKKIPYKCDTCVLGFNKEDTFILHMTTKHNETIGIFVCDVCKVRFPGLYAMERHRQCHYTRYRCKLCKYEATRIQVMLSHCQVKHNGDECGMIRCQQCEFTAGSPEEMSDHQTKEHSLICNDCGMKFKGKPTLRKHKKRIHGQNREFICDVCNKTFKTKSRLESHIVTHSDSIAAKLSYCAVCQMQYKNIYVYRNHLKNNVNHSERSYQCQTCHKRFATKVYWKMHCDFYHLRKSQYKCQLCDKLFISSWRLKNHRQMHHGLSRSRNHTCNVCGKKFYTLSTMRDHQLTHSNQRPYMCEDCGDTFKQRPALYNHTKLVHQGFKRKSKQAIKH